jgi:hypothetical protein
MSNVSNGLRLSMGQKLKNDPGVIVIKRATTEGTIGLQPIGGFNLSGLTLGKILGVYVSALGVHLYNPAVGPNVAVRFDFSKATNLLTLFDFYRIRKVTIKAYISNNTSSVANTTNANPLFYTCIDYDGGATVPSAVSDVLGYGNALVHQSGKIADKPTIKRTWVPRITNNMTGNIVTSNNYGIMPERTWVDNQSSTCPHWGMFIAYDAQQATQIGEVAKVTIICEAEMEFKGLN